MTNTDPKPDQITVFGGIDLPSHLTGDTDADFPVPSDDIGQKLATLIRLHPNVKHNFSHGDLTGMDVPTKQLLLNDLLQVLKIPKLNSSSPL